MATFQVPSFPALGAYDFKLELDGELFQFNFQFNDRADFWYFDLFDNVGNPVRQGVKMVTGIPLLLRDVEENVPAGSLIMVDTTGQGQEADLDGLGQDVKFFYIEAE